MDSTTVAATAAPLCVDLDGTLVKSDTLVDSVCVFARARPFQLWRLPLWLLRGKAGFKRALAENSELDVTHLPLNQALMASLRVEHHKGRQIFLTTGANEKLAHRVAAELGIFSGVVASGADVNLTGNKKLSALKTRFADTGFEYIGNAKPDAPLLESAQEAWLANPDAGLIRHLRRRGVKIRDVYQDRAPLGRSLAKAIRVSQWSKNVLLFVPLVLAHAWTNHRALLATIIAFICFCLCASSTYILNDLLDIESDRRHPRKRFRPFAAGDLGAGTGLLIIALFLAAAGILLYWEPRAFMLWLGFYVACTIAYSFFLKRMPIVDVMMLAGLYTIRILAGGAAASVVISPWLGGFSIFFFLSLAMVKRFSELHTWRVQDSMPRNNRGYVISDFDQIRTFGIAAGYASVVVFTLYISNPDVRLLYHHPARLWLLAPILVYWISRVWLIAGRGQMHDDPVTYAISDRASWVLGLLAVLCIGSAM
jgi:4-hydroxybenzoate polyprenyltransferase